VVVERCTFIDNSSGMGNGTLKNSIIVGCTHGPACAGEMTVSCSLFWGNAEGDACWPDGNLFADPQFCAVDPGTSLHVGLQSDSPAATSSCGRIGAREVTCGTVATRPESWGKVKSLYRE
jgi:hypothetical protein